MLGNLVTSALGFVRQYVIARYFHAYQSDAFFAAYTVPQMFYDLAIGGAIAAALIPTFTRLQKDDRDHFWQVVSAVFVLASAVVIVLIVVLEIGAAPLMNLIAAGFRTSRGHRRLTLSIELVRLMLPTLFFWALSAVSLAALYSLGRRVAASFATACFHLGIIVVGYVVGVRLGMGVAALSLGAIAGAAAQFAVQIPSLWRARGKGWVWLTTRIDLRDPMVRKIVILYGPVALGIVVSIAGQIADVEFKSHLHSAGWYSDMQYATTLVQFPVGIVVAALGLAVLPMISSDAAAGQLDAFKSKLGLGFRLVLVLMVPAALGLMLLGQPIANLLFHHGQLSAGQTVQIGRALLGYAPQLPFIGIDQLLIFAFYARHNTVVPMLAGVAGVCVYVISALVLDHIFDFQVLGLAIANTLQIVFHMTLLLILLTRWIGTVEVRSTLVTLGKVVVATAGMCLGLAAVHALTSANFAGALATVLNVAAPMAAAVVIYLAALYLLKLNEMSVLAASIRARLG